MNALDLDLLKKIFLGFSLAALLALPLDAALVRLGFGAPPDAAPLAETLAPPPAPLEPLASYEAALEKSALFGLASAEPALPILKSSISELAKDYRLKGIFRLGEIQAILEDARTQKTVFVKPGDTLGELKVKEIRDGSVVIAYYGEEKELRIESARA